MLCTLLATKVSLISRYTSDELFRIDYQFDIPEMIFGGGPYRLDKGTLSHYQEVCKRKKLKYKKHNKCLYKQIYCCIVLIIAHT